MDKNLSKAIKCKGLLVGSLLPILLFSVVLAAACQSQSPAPSPGLPEETSPGALPSAPPNIEVAIEGFAFKPATLTVPVGSTIIWYNNDSVPHTVTARDNLFDSGNLPRDGTFSYTFDQKGTFEYYCTLHPRMTATVIVE
jgi:plastocyanin